MKNIQTGERGGSAKLVAGEAVAVKEGLEFGVVSEEGIEHRLRGERGGHGKVTAGHAFGQSHKIRLHTFEMAGGQPILAGAAKAGHHFIGNQLRAVAADNLGDAAQPACRLGDHAGGALHQGLDDHRGAGISGFFAGGEFFFNERDALVVAFAVIAGIGVFGFGAVKRAAVTVRRHDAVGLEKEAGISLVKEINVPETDSAEGVTVIRALQGKKSGIFGKAGAPGINVSELESDFHGGGTVVGEKHLREPGRAGGGSGVG